MKVKVKDTDRIILPRGNGKKLAQEIGVTPMTVCYALKGAKTMSDQTFHNIRNKAMKFYGGRILL